MKRSILLLSLLFAVAGCAAWFEEKNPKTVATIDSWSQPVQASDWGFVTATVKWQNVGEDPSVGWSTGTIVVTCADSSEYSRDFVASGLSLDVGESITADYTIDTYGKQAATAVLRDVHFEEFGD